VKKLITPEAAAKLVKTGDTIMVGGFGLSGVPQTMVDALSNYSARELTVISNNVGEPGRGLGKLLHCGKMRKAIGSYFTTNRDAVEAWKKGELEIQLLPQGTFIEAIRAGGAGIGGFYTRTSLGTKIAEGKELKDIDGDLYVFEKALKADVSIIKAHKADQLGNLVYYKTALNFNAAMATAGRIVIAEVDEIVETGEFLPEEVRTSHAYVDYVVLNRYVKKDGRYVV
jgi:3-oxoacid CoA-transferase subunit A